MTRTRYNTATSIDGYIADPDNSLTWLFEVEGASEAEADSARFFAGVGAMCMGATTYEWLLANQSDQTWHDTYGDMPAWIFTHRDLRPIPGANLRFVSGDVAAVHRDMAAAAGDRDIWIIGGGELAGAFADAGLLDEVIISLAPVSLGGGAPLLPRRLLSDRLSLTAMRQVGQFAELTYRVS